MGDNTGCFRCIVIMINLLFFIIAITLVSIGIIVNNFGDSFLYEHLDEIVDQIRDSLNSTYGGSSYQAVTASNIDLSDLFKFAAVFFICAGSALLIICVLGLLGACCKIRCMLLLYSGIIIGLIAMQIVFFALLLWDHRMIKQQLKSPLKSILSDYKGLNGTDTASVTWNFVMTKYSCCGVDNYHDFSTSQWLFKNEHVTPWACCTTLPDSLTKADECAGASGTAAVSTIAGKNNYDKGCVEEIFTNVIKDKRVYIGLAAFFILAIQIVLVIFACKVSNDNKTGPGGKPHKRSTRSQIEPQSHW